MALALTMYEDGVCSGCGGHHSVTHGDENVGRWDIGEDMCHRCAAIESAQEQGKKDGYPGKKLTVIDLSEG